jgi:hypothetical protein
MLIDVSRMMLLVDVDEKVNCLESLMSVDVIQASH